VFVFTEDVIMDPRLFGGLVMLAILPIYWATRPLETVFEKRIRRLVRRGKDAPPAAMQVGSSSRFVYDIVTSAVWAVAALSLIVQGIVSS
jgi:hypothetical protein